MLGFQWALAPEELVSSIFQQPDRVFRFPPFVTRWTEAAAVAAVSATVAAQHNFLRLTATLRKASTCGIIPSSAAAGFFDGHVEIRFFEHRVLFPPGALQDSAAVFHHH